MGEPPDGTLLLTGTTAPEQTAEETEKKKGVYQQTVWES